MKKKKSRIVYEAEEIRDFRELIRRTASKYPDQIAYKYKIRNGTEAPEYVNKTYSQFQKDIEGFSTGLLSMGLKGKKIAVIGNNRYEWCTTYLAVTTGGMIIVPLDKALPENEIESLIKRSGAEAIVCEEKYVPAILKIKKEEQSQLKYIICMDETEEKEVLNYQEVLKQGRKLRNQGNQDYEQIILNPNEMSIILYTSGTTGNPKGVMINFAKTYKVILMKKKENLLLKI